MTYKRVVIATLTAVLVLLLIVGAVKFFKKPSVAPQANEPALNTNEVIHETVIKSLPEGAEIYVNSGLSWDINVPESRIAEAESVAQGFLGEDFTVESLEERMIFDTSEFLNRDLKIVMYDVDDNGTTYYYTYVFDANDGELLSHTATPSFEGISKVRSFVIKLDEAGF